MADAALRNYLRERHLFLGRTVIASFIVIGIISLLVFRLYRLQVVDHDHFKTLAQDNRVKVQPLAPTRGLIYDRRGKLIAYNRPAYSLEITPEQVSDLELTLSKISEIIMITPDELVRFHRLKKQKRRFDSIPIRINLSPEDAALFSVHRHELPGVDIHARLLRHYPEADKTAHVLGYVGRISEKDLGRLDASNYAGSHYTGKTGVERTYESTLHGQVGLQRVEVNAYGRPVRVLEQDKPSPGRDLHLHLDTQLQDVAIQAFADHTGSAVAIDPKTGGILAMVSKPGFDPNLFVVGISSKAYGALQSNDDNPLYNRAMRGQYPPGSTVKPFMGLAGLETDTIQFDSSKYCPGFFRLPGHSHKYRDWKKTGHGTMRLDDAITQSCDVFFYQLAYDMGIDKMHDYLGQFRFGQKTGVDIIGESPGLLPSREWKRKNRRQPWYPGETLIVGIGQGYFLTTPLQLAAATAAIANGGTYHTPRIVSRIGDHPEETDLPLPVASHDIPIKNQLHWEDVQRAMVQVTEHPRGTAKRIRNEHYRIAGKTGTAQVFSIKQDEEYDEESLQRKMLDHALFVAYAPVEDPQIAVAIIVEHGKHGGSTAAPIARMIMDAYLLKKTQQEAPG